jgi:hypothetical protein
LAKQEIIDDLFCGEESWEKINVEDDEVEKKQKEKKKLARRI